MDLQFNNIIQSKKLQVKADLYSRVNSSQDNIVGFFL